MYNAEGACRAFCTAVFAVARFTAHYISTPRDLPAVLNPSLLDLPEEEDVTAFDPRTEHGRIVIEAAKTLVARISNPQ